MVRYGMVWYGFYARVTPAVNLALSRPLVYEQSAVNKNTLPYFSNNYLVFPPNILLNL